MLPGAASNYFDIVMRAVIAGNSPGNIWADSSDHLTSALMRDVGHCCYLAGDPNNAAFITDLRSHIAEHIAPQTIAEDRAVFKLYYTSPAWKGRCEQIFESTLFKKLASSLFILEQPISTNWRSRLAPPTAIQQIDAGLLWQRGVGNVQSLIDEVTAMWGSVDDFLSKGFDFCLLYEGRIACWCTAEYGSSKSIGVGMETSAQYYNQGFATLTAAAFVEYCAGHNLTAYWDAWSDNLPSLAVAEKLGFKKVSNYAVRLCKFV